MFYPKTHTVISLKVIFSKNSNFALNYANLLKKICKEAQDDSFRNNENYCLPKSLGFKKIFVYIWDDVFLKIIFLSLVPSNLCKKFKNDQAIK